MAGFPYNSRWPTGKCRQADFIGGEKEFKWQSPNGEHGFVG
jgi:hypothetical protein